MNQYRRIVSYLYRYGEGQKGENIGFVRLDTKEEGLRMHVHIRDSKMIEECRLKVYFYFHKENKMQLVFVDEFCCKRGNCEYRNMVYPDFSDGDFEKMAGVVIMDAQELVYGSCWDENEIKAELLQRDKAEGELEESENAVEEKEDSPLQMEEDSFEMEEQIIESAEIPTAESTFWNQFPKLVLYSPQNIVDAVKIKRKDITMLSCKDWKLADNEFLKQGYGQAEHLLLGRIRMQNEKEVWILGVPGIYDNREKYLAGIFGFTEYIPVEEGDYLTGGEGYWIRQIESVSENGLD